MPLFTYLHMFIHLFVLFTYLFIHNMITRRVDRDSARLLYTQHRTTPTHEPTSPTARQQGTSGQKPLIVAKAQSIMCRKTTGVNNNRPRRTLSLNTGNLSSRPLQACSSESTNEQNFKLIKGFSLSTGKGRRAKKKSLPTNRGP